MKILSRRQKNVLFRNDKAFTLIEALFALAIFSTIVFFMTPIFQIMVKNIISDAKLQTMEWDVFCSQIKKEIRMSSNAEILSNRLFLTKDADTIMYEKYGNNMRRRVNSTGHEIVLQNVEEISFSNINNSVIITVKDVWGKKYSMIAYSFVTWKTVQ